MSTWNTTIHHGVTVRLVTDPTPHATYVAEGDEQTLPGSWLFSEIDQLLDHEAMDTKRYAPDTFHVAAWCGTRTLKYTRPFITENTHSVRSYMIGQIHVGTHHVGVASPDSCSFGLDNIWIICLEVTEEGVMTSATRVTTHTLEA